MTRPPVQPPLLPITADAAVLAELLTEDAEAAVAPNPPPVDAPFVCSTHFPAPRSRLAELRERLNAGTNNLGHDPRNRWTHPDAAQVGEYQIGRTLHRQFRCPNCNWAWWDSEPTGLRPA